MPEWGRARRLDRVTRGGDGSITDGVRGHLKPCPRRGGDDLSKLGRRRPPDGLARAHRGAFRSTVDEDLDRSSAHQGAAETRSYAEAGSRLEQLPREELIDAHPQASAPGQLLISTKVIGEPAVDGRTDRCDATRDQEALRFQDSLRPAMDRR